MVCDGSQRTLCVDGVVVAEDTQSDLTAFACSLDIGVGKDYATCTFFSGLIDDIRIYEKTDRRDAKKLLGLFMADMLTEVYPPDEQQ